MKPTKQSIIFDDGRIPIHHVEAGMIGAVLNMAYMPEVTTMGDLLCFENMNADGEYDVYIINEEGKRKVASVINDPNMIETVKEVKSLGNSIAVAISSECKMLGIQPGDKIRIRIEKIEE